MAEEATVTPTVLDRVERRLLGVLVEKAKTTPENYPMTVNALVVGSNQKSNRDPVLSLSDLEVEDGLATLQQKGFVTRITGSRVERWRHNLYELWHVGKVELAILTELLLRGAQTEGELRTRASRMEPINDLETLRATLRPLAERGFVVFLGPEGRRGSQITHGFLSPRELEAARLQRPTVEEEAPVAPTTTPRANDKPTGLETELGTLRDEMGQLKSQLAQMQTSLQTLSDAFHALKQSLGA